jgi:hypothetical protein
MLVCAFAMLVPAPSALADAGHSTDAVASQPLAFTGGYRLDFFDEDAPGVDAGLSNLGFLELRFPLPAPLPPEVGAAVMVDAAGTDQWLDGTPDLDSEGLGATAEMFWRDPSSGFVAVFYRFGRVSNEVGGVSNDQDRHTGGAVLGVYDGDFDIIGRASYSRVSNDVATAGEKVDGGYRAEAEGAWYPHDSTRLQVALLWSHVPSNPLDPRSAQARLGVQWQPPIGGHRYVRVGVDGGFGRIWRDLPGSDQSKFLAVGASLTFDWPGSASLKERLRTQSRF